jgi:hypothetical protein
MKTTHLVGLTAAAVLAVAGAVTVSLTGTSPSSDMPSSARLFPSLAGQVNDVGRIAIARKDETVTVVKKGDTWVVAEKYDYPAAFDKVRKLLVDLAELRPLEQKTSTPSVFATLELEDLSEADAKSALVTVKGTDDKDFLALYVGKQRFSRGSSGGDGTYVRKAGDNQTWLTKGRLQVDKGVATWLDKIIADVARERIAKVTVVQPDGAKLVVTRSTPAEKNFTIVDMPKNRKAKSEYDVNNLAGPLERLELDDVRPAAEVTAPAKAGYAELVTFDGLLVRATLVPKDDQVWLQFATQFTPPAAAPSEQDVKDGKLKTPDEVKKEAETLAAKTSAWAYRIADWKLDNLRKKVGDLLEEEKKGS